MVTEKRPGEDEGSAIEKRKGRRTYATVWDIGLGQSLFALGWVWFAWVIGYSESLELADGVGTGGEVKKRDDVGGWDTHLKALAPACHSLPTSIFILTDL